jgi:osmotically-inducible protein OsmY
MMPRTAILSYVIFLIIFAPGCADVAMSGAQVVYNRHSLEKNFNDQYLTMEAFKRLKIDNDSFKNANIAIATFNGEMLLAGQVPDYRQRVLAGQVVKSIPDVKEVYNLLTVANPSSTMTRISDAWITTKIKAKFLASDDLDANQIKVVTENGTVYLMGIIKPNEAQAAVDLARETAGVENVVKMFSYITISKYLPGQHSS